MQRRGGGGGGLPLVVLIKLRTNFSHTKYYTILKIMMMRSLVLLVQTYVRPFMSMYIKCRDVGPIHVYYYTMSYNMYIEGL